MSATKHAEQPTKNPLETAVDRMMGGTTAPGHGQGEIVIGEEYGRTPYSGEAEKLYAGTEGKRASLDAGEYYAVTQGYLREWVCMGQCNLFIQVLQNPVMRKSMETYRRDVCEPNLAEMKRLLDDGGYELPAPFNAERDSKSVDELGRLETDAIDDKMILIGHIFAVEGFMNRWNHGAAMSHRAEVREAFVRNWHRANRWHLASIAMAENMQFVEPQPEVRI